MFAEYIKAGEYTDPSIREEAQESFKRVLRVLDLLAALKTTNGHLSDAEYRKKAEDILRVDFYKIRVHLLARQFYSSYHCPPWLSVLQMSCIY